MTESSQTPDPTPRWGRARRDYPEAHAALQRVAEAVYERTEEPVDVGDAEVGLPAALQLGFLESRDEGVTFSEPDVRRDYLIRHVTGVALPAWDDPARFADALADAQRRTLGFSERREMATVVLIVLAREHGKDVVGRVGELARLAAESEGRERLFWELYDPFCEALPELEIEPRKLAKALEAVFEVTTNDGMAGSVYNAVQKLAGRSWAEGDALYETFASRPTSPLITFVPATLVGFASTDLEEAHRRALDMSMATESAARRAGIAALGLFDYSVGDHDCLLETTWTRLERCRSEPDPEVDYALARAYGNLLDQKPEAAEAMVELSARPDPAVQGQISWVLLRKADEAHGEAWFRMALLNLTGTSASQMGAWENLDHCASRFAQDDPDLVINFMEAAVLRGYYGTAGGGVELPKMLDGAFAELVRHHPKELEAAVTRWFASSERRLHRAARDVVHTSYNLLSTEQPWLKLDKQVLDTLDDQVAVYALQRIMGHVVSSRPLTALLLSAVQRESCSPTFLNFVTQALAGYVLYNYPNEAGGYLRSQVEGGEASDAELKVATVVLENSDAYSKALRDLPRLKEFHTPTRRLYLLRLAEHKQRAAIMEEADRQSVVMSLATRVPLKYGRGFFMEREGSFTEPSNLSSFSHSVEKPRGELIDPIGQAVQRMEWQSVGLHEDQTQGQPDEETAP